MRILDEIKRMLLNKPKVPDCYEDGEFLYCWCGKCKPKDYELPEDFKKLLTMRILDDFKNNPHD